MARADAGQLDHAGRMLARGNAVAIELLSKRSPQVVTLALLGEPRADHVGRALLASGASAHISAFGLLALAASPTDQPT